MVSPPLRLPYFSPLIAWMVTIFLTSSIPGDRIPDVEWTYADKMVHVGIYATLASLAWLAFGHYAEVKGRSIRWVAVMSGQLSVIYGATDEVHQLFVRNRSCEWADFFADVLGVLLAIGVLWWRHEKRSTT